MMQKYRLNIGNGLTKYNPKTDPRVSNEFSTVNKTFHHLILLFKVAFRFGHSQIQHEFRPYVNGTKAINPQAEDGDNIDLHRRWLLSFGYFQIDKFNIGQGGKSWLNEIEGLIKQKCPEADLRVENSLTNELFLKQIRPKFHREWTSSLFGTDRNSLCFAMCHCVLESVILASSIQNMSPLPDSPHSIGLCLCRIWCIWRNWLLIKMCPKLFQSLPLPIICRCQTVDELGVIFVCSWWRFGCTKHPAWTWPRNSRLPNLQIKDLRVNNVHLSKISF